MLPASLQLPLSLPRGAEAYRRRFISPATNSTSFGPDDYINIYPDTSTPGAFVDPHSCYLMLDLLIKNQCPYVDYAQFHEEGVGGAIIQDLLTVNQGSPLEEIREYGTVAAAITNSEGCFDGEFSMYFPNSLVKGFECENELNLIKPPMCDGNGAIMFQRNLDDTLSTSKTGRHTLNTSGFLTTAAATVGTGAGRGGCMFELSRCNDLPIQSINDGVSPLNWPSRYNPQHSSIERDFAIEFGSINKPMVLCNLTNTKCIPIGVKCSATVSDPEIITATNTFTAVDTKYRICYPLISGIWGRLNPKMVATCLMAPQQICINIHLAPAHIALHLSFDPNRRILDTARDFVRNVGTRNGGKWLDTTYESGTSTLLSRCGYDPYEFIKTELAIGYTPSLAILPANTASTIFRPKLDKLKTSNSYSKIGSFTTAASVTAGLAGDGCDSVSITSVIVKGVSLSTAQVTRLMDYIGDDAIVSTTVNGSNYWGISGINLYSTGDTDVFNFKCLGGGNGTSTSIANSTNYFIYGRTAASFSTYSRPQYILASVPSTYRGTSTLTTPVTYLAETEALYGSYLTASVPQTARMFQFSASSPSYTSPLSQHLTVAPYTINNGTITYEVSNVALVGDQICFDNAIAADIVTKAASDGYIVHTNSVRAYQLQITPGSTQNIICPIKLSQCKRLMFVFQNTAQRQPGTGFFYSSNCGHNPFASVDIAANDTIMKKAGYYNNGTSTDLSGVGYTKPLVIQNMKTVPGNSNSMSVQLRLGNEYYPPQPITTWQELCAEYVKTMEGWMDPDYSPEIDQRIIKNPTDGSLEFDCTQPSRYGTAFIPQQLMDDQTIKENYDLAPLYSYNSGVATCDASYMDSTIATATSKYNGMNFLPPRGYCMQKMFVPPSSKFVLAFNLSNFKKSDGIDCGEYLGNGVIQLNMTGAVGLEHKGINTFTDRAICIAPHRVLMKYGPEGNIIWNY